MTIAGRIGWSLMTFLSLGVAAYAIFLVATNFVHVPREVASNGFFSEHGLHIRQEAAADVLEQIDRLTTTTYELSEDEVAALFARYDR